MVMPGMSANLGLIGGGGPVVLITTFTDGYELSTGASTYSPTGIAIGDASPFRYVIACPFLYTDELGTITCSMNGNAMTALASAQATDVDGDYVQNRFFIIAAPSGTTADFSFGTGAISGHGALAVWSVLSSTVPTVVDSDISSVNGALSMNAAAGGAQLVYGYTERSTPFTDLSVTGLTKDQGPVSLGSSKRVGAAHADFASAVTPNSIDFAWTGGSGTAYYHTAGISLSP